MLSPRCGFAEIYGSGGARLLAFRVLTCWEIKKKTWCARGSGLYFCLYGFFGVIASKKPGKNRDFWWHTVFYVAVGWCGAKTAFVNFRNLFFFFQKNMLCFPIKSEIGQIFECTRPGLCP